MTSSVDMRPVAILMINLGEERAASILRHMREDEAEEIAAAISEIAEVGQEESLGVLHETESLLAARRHLRAGGVDYARNMLHRAYGVRADQILARLREATLDRPFDELARLAPDQLLPLLHGAPPQSAALVLAHLPPDLAANVLRLFQPEARAEIAWRILQLGNPKRRVSQEAIAELAAMLRTQAGALQDDQTKIGGVEALARLLTRMLRSDEQQVLDDVRRRNAEVAEQVLANMFTFDDLVKLHPNDLRTLIGAVDGNDLALALKLTSQAVRDSVFSVLSEERRTSLQEQIEYLPPKRRREVEEAQARIIQAARQLEADNQLVLRREEQDLV